MGICNFMTADQELAFRQKARIAAEHYDGKELVAQIDKLHKRFDGLSTDSACEFLYNQDWSVVGAAAGKGIVFVVLAVIAAAALFFVISMLFRVIKFVLMRILDALETKGVQVNREAIANFAAIFSFPALVVGAIFWAWWVS